MLDTLNALKGIKPLFKRGELFIMPIEIQNRQKSVPLLIGFVNTQWRI
jgi:hypothetical protein